MPYLEPAEKAWISAEWCVIPIGRHVGELRLLDAGGEGECIEVII
jgi:hypothetical protein